MADFITKSAILILAPQRGWSWALGRADFDMMANRGEATLLLRADDETPHLLLFLKCLLAICNLLNSSGFRHLIIDIAITPGFARLERPDHRVTGGMKVRGGMFIF
jgi:hypothetical protein